MDDRRPALTTMWCDDDPLWSEHCDVIRDGLSLPRWLLRFARESRSRRAIVLRGTVTLADGYRDLLGAALLRLLLNRHRREDPLVLISDATITPYSQRLADRLGLTRLLPSLSPRLLPRLLPWLARCLVRAVDGPSVRWCVLSHAEVNTFAAAWGVPVERVLVTPFRHTLWEADAHRVPLPAIEGAAPSRIFSGGNSLRDYPLLLAAFAGLDEASGAQLQIATDRLPARREGRVEVAELTPQEYVAALHGCDVLVVPLAAAGRSAGQQTYLSGMALGAVVLVSDPSGAAADYIEDGVTGVLVPADSGDPADPAALIRALQDVLDPQRREHYLRMRRRARAVALRSYSPESYRRRLLVAAGLVPGLPDDALPDDALPDDALPASA